MSDPRGAGDTVGGGVDVEIGLGCGELSKLWFPFGSLL